MASKAQNVEVKKPGDNGGPGRQMTGSGFLPFMSLRDEIDRTFDRFLSEPRMAPSERFRELWNWAPFRPMGSALGNLMISLRTDMTESEKEYVLTVELPGMDEKDIDLTVTENSISLNGEKKSEQEVTENDYHLTERSYGRCQRSFAMPAGVDVEKVKASFSKGVLTVNLPKTKEARAKPRKVEVKSA
jgi:HSP20 family protein